MSAEQHVTRLEKELASAPKHGRNAAWILLKELAGDDPGNSGEASSEAVKRSPSCSASKPAGEQTSGYVKVDISLFDVMPKILRPNIEVNRKAKIPRGPRITWLNRSIALYLKFIGCNLLKIKAGAPLKQEVKFNAGLCRCAISAAQAHEGEAFARCANATVYHAAMMKKHPSLKFIPHDRLTSLCNQYGQPCPEMPASEAQTKRATVSEASLASPPAGNVANTLVKPSATNAQAVDGGQAGLSTAGEIGAGSGSKQGGTAAGISGDLQNESNNQGQSPGVESGNVDRGTGRSECENDRKEMNDLLQDLFGNDSDDCPVDENAANGSEPEGEGGRVREDAEDGASRDETGPALGDSGNSTGLDDGPSDDEKPKGKRARADGEDEDGPREAHPDEEFQEFARERKRGKTQRGDVGKAGTGSHAAAKVRLEVQTFVGELLEPWLRGNRIDVRQYTSILGRVVEKVVGAHPKAEDAGFLEGEAAAIRKLVDRYVKFTVKE